ncbi:MAG TPA: hypothetical protein VLG50_00555 [Candidatus Saccharimonadales bacterium]|nr:hypothetical protein [Candidatus Saccharimonadales bacterium]
MKLRIILFSFISLSMMASQPAQRGQQTSASVSSKREALITAVMELKRPITPIPPSRFNSGTITEMEERRYKAELDIYTIERKRYLELLERIFNYHYVFGNNPDQYHK